MRKKIIVRLLSYITLVIMIASVAIYLLGAAHLLVPAILGLLVSSWLHGICWGYLYALEGRLTWF